MQIGPYETHPLADELDPMLGGEDLDAFVDDVDRNGFRNPRVYLYKGKLLDGRNRGVAAERTGRWAELELVEYSGEDPIGLIKSLNQHRMHQSESVRAAFAATRALRQPGRPKKGAGAPNDPTIAELAADAGVSERTLKEAKYAIDTGVPELEIALKTGQVSASVAAELADLPREEQLEQLLAKKPATRNELRKRRASSDKRKAPHEVLLTTAKDAWTKIGATIETLEAGAILVRYDDITFELRLQRAEPGQGRGAA